MERYCPACGTQRADGVSFCSQCGHRFGSPGADGSLPPATPPSPPPSVPPAITAPPPLSEGPPPAPDAGESRAPLPQQGAGGSSLSGRRILFILFGLALFLTGLYKVLDGLGALSGGGSSSSLASSPSAALGAIDEQWLVGTWTPAELARCSTWVRFNADRTLLDETGNTGTWQLQSHGVATGRLTMTIAGLPPRTMEASRSGQDILGFPGPRYWNRAVC